MPEPTLADDLARFYDLDLVDDPGDVDLYLALAGRTGGPVLELAAGTGRLAVPLARAGHDVVAVDHDPSMLARASRYQDTSGIPAAGGTPGRQRARPSARPNRGSLGLVEHDLRTVDLGARFALAFIGLNSLLQLGTADAQRAAVAALARHLAPTGLAAIDVWLPTADDLAVYDGRLILEWVRDDPETGDRVAKAASARYDAATATVELRAIYDAWPPGGGSPRRVDRCDRLRLVGVEELVRMATDAGLAIDTLACDHDLTPFGPGAPRLLLLARLL